MMRILPTNKARGGAVTCSSMGRGEKVRTRGLCDDDAVGIGDEEVEQEVANNTGEGEHAGE